MTYDLNGNLTAGAGRTLTWNGENRLSQAVYGGLTTTFTYDSTGERLKKVQASNTLITPFGDDYEVRNGTITKYISAEGLGVLAKKVGSTTYWIHTDRLGSINVETNSSGQETSSTLRRSYRPYGETLSSTGSLTETRGWIDQRNDTAETGLTYLHARYFDPKLGQFLSPDPIGTAGGLNSYSYGLANPISFHDRSGLMGSSGNGCQINVAADGQSIEGGGVCETVSVGAAGGGGFLSFVDGLIDLIDGGLRARGLDLLGRERSERDRERDPGKVSIVIPVEIECSQAGGGEGCPDAPPVAAAAVAGGPVGVFIGAEGLFHYGLSLYALFNVYPPTAGQPTPDRQRHCWVNCVSTRAHLMNPAVPLIISAGQESPNYDSVFRQLVAGEGLDPDFRADWQANYYGQREAWRLWRPCKDLCDELPGRRR
jgi:RHS repeat-associated protein